MFVMDDPCVIFETGAISVSILMNFILQWMKSFIQITPVHFGTELFSPVGRGTKLDKEKR